ncbi:MAG: hypothetical protein J5701_02800 [Bacteroidales bacterium]|nr:hypothetical protein [Bacteroidales bacterium]
MKTRYTFSIVLAALLLLVNIRLFAQSQYDVVVNSNFSPSISDAQEKINAKAEIKDTVKNVRAVAYNVETPVYDYSLPPQPINAPKVGKDMIARLYRNYLKVGFGNYITPYLDFEANSLRSTQYTLSAKVFHHSSWGKIKTYAPAHFSDTRVNLYGQKYFNNYTLAASAGYNHLLAECYGFQPDTVFGDLKKDSTDKIDIKGKDIARQYHHAFADMSLASNALHNAFKLNQYYHVGYDFLTDNNKNTYEHLLNMDVAIDHNIKVKKMEYINVGGTLGMDYQHNRWQGTNLTDNWKIYLNPFAALQWKDYYFKVGFNATFSLAPQQKLFHIYPDIEAKLAFVPNIFSLYLKVDGGLRHNSLLRMIGENPYLSDVLPIYNIDEKTRIYLGLQTSVSRSLTIGAGASFSFYEGLPFYMPDTNHTFTYRDSTVRLFNTFTLTDDTTTAKVLNVHFDLNYKYADMLKLGCNVDYNLYLLSKNVLKPWYQPALTVQFNAQYILLKKFVFKLDFYVSAFACRPDFSGETVKSVNLSPVFDFDFGFEYLWSKRFSIFADLNNFPCQRNRVYYDYPNHRINALVGVKYCFGGEAVNK